MYPYSLIRFPDGSGISLYEIFILIGVIAAIVTFSILAEKRGMPHRLQNLILFGGVISFVVGYGSAVLFQAIYNALETGIFVINKNTGATFYGGFLGGAACMLLIYFIGGKILYRHELVSLRWFPTFANIAAACVALAHGFGRIGCLMGGCCHGGETDAWYGIPMDIGALDGEYVKVVPLQLYEAIFLLGLAAFLIVRILQKKGMAAPLYFLIYGVWRFFIEFFRADDRGASFIPALSPSQVTALFLILVGIGIYCAYFIIRKKYGADFFQKLPKEAESSGGGSKQE